MYKNITKIALRGIALAMGVAVLVMSTLKTLDINTGVAMLGLGLAAKESSFEILSVQDHLGIARWQSTFTVVESGKRLALDCLFVVEFDEAGLCQSFREWWHIREC